jgi:chemotaxis protein histidine kinase CheA
LDRQLSPEKPHLVGKFCQVKNPGLSSPEKLLSQLKGFSGCDTPWGQKWFCPCFEKSFCGRYGVHMANKATNVFVIASIDACLSLGWTAQKYMMLNPYTKSGRLRQGTRNAFKGGITQIPSNSVVVEINGEFSEVEEFLEEALRLAMAEWKKHNLVSSQKEAAKPKAEVLQFPVRPATAEKIPVCPPSNPVKNQQEIPQGIPSQVEGIPGAKNLAELKAMKVGELMVYCHDFGGAEIRTVAHLGKNELLAYAEQNGLVAPEKRNVKADIARRKKETRQEEKQALQELVKMEAPKIDRNKELKAELLEIRERMAMLEALLTE